jgi:hypothetical protein
VLIDIGAGIEAMSARGSGAVPDGTALQHAAVFGMTDVVDVLQSRLPALMFVSCLTSVWF